MPCSDEFRSASLSYRPTLATAAFCNPIAPAHSCRDVRSLIPPTSSPTPTVRAAPPFFPPPPPVGPPPPFSPLFPFPPTFFQKKRGYFLPQGKFAQKKKKKKK